MSKTRTFSPHIVSVSIRGLRSLSFAPTLRMLTEVRQSRYQPAAD